MKDIHIGLLGLGNIGKGVYRILETNKNPIQNHIGANLKIQNTGSRHSQNRDIDVAQELLTEDAYEIINDPKIDMIWKSSENSPPMNISKNPYKTKTCRYCK